MDNPKPSANLPDGTVQYFSHPTATVGFRDDVLRGLAAPQKAIPPKYFYDEHGSALFERICALPEYYPMRTEMAIMQGNIGAIAEALGPRCGLIEFGSGASLKTCILIEQLQPPVYIPIDISESALRAATATLAARYRWLNIGAVCGDFTHPINMPDFGAVEIRRKVAFFPGSTIGNFTQEEALAFMRLTRLMVGKGGGLLIGVDLKKAKPILDAAYDDAQGVTALFNLNLLARINRELGGDFRLDQFWHRGFYNELLGRIEMHLESTCAQTVHIGASAFSFRAGETIHTENSYKYTIDEFRSIARTAGFRPDKVWVDEKRMFSVHAMAAV
ncbi:MAG: L-histidine N(alpha)-methyltransferase [Betaproteobacteria bacterium]|nr:L-histidine N(alpha)-methyltransferase [Betaproteobacteria bacterium]